MAARKSYRPRQSLEERAAGVTAENAGREWTRYRRTIAGYQSELNRRPPAGVRSGKQPMIQLWDYVGLDRASYPEPEELAIAIKERYYRIQSAIQQQRVRGGQRLADAPDALVLYFAVAYRNGRGLYFLAYVDEPVPEADFTEIDLWD